jgi:hypothetical protein
MTLVRIRAVEPLEGFRLRLHLTNDAVIERDVRPLMNGQIFEELIQDSQRFREVCVGTPLAPRFATSGRGSPPITPTYGPGRTNLSLTQSRLPFRRSAWLSCGR